MKIGTDNEQIWQTSQTIQLERAKNGPHLTIFPTHWHKDFELLFIDEGVLHLNIAGEKIVAHAGDTVIINPYYTHEGLTDTEGLRHRILVFDPTPLCEHEASNNLLQPYLKQNAAFNALVRDDDLRAIADELFAIEDRSRPNDILLYTGLLYRLLFLLLERHCNTSFCASSTHKRIHKVIDYINEHYCEDITPSSLSQMFGYQESYFSRLFKATTSLRPIEYIRVLRLEKARQMLREPTVGIASVAKLCGFTDLNYFSRCFKVRYGITATQYREAKNGKQQS